MYTIYSLRFIQLLDNGICILQYKAIDTGWVSADCRTEEPNDMAHEKTGKQIGAITTK